MIKVHELMVTELLTLKEYDHLYKARQLMMENRIRHLPILNDKDECVGLLSQRDMLYASVSRFAEISEEERREIESSIPIREVMTHEIIAVEEDTNLHEATDFMTEHKIGCLPVLDGGKLVGILTESDFLKLVSRLLGKME